MTSIRVLIAEDHVLLREGLRALLERAADMRVVGEAGDGAEAVNLAGRLQPHVVLMDIAMPVLDGIRATRRIRERHPETFVACLSMHAERRLLDAAMDAGASAYLLKECAGTELLAAVRSVAGGRRYVSPSLANPKTHRAQADTGRGQGPRPRNQRAL